MGIDFFSGPFTVSRVGVLLAKRKICPGKSFSWSIFRVAGGDAQNTQTMFNVGQKFGVADSTVWTIVGRVADRIIEHLTQPFYLRQKVQSSAPSQQVFVNVAEKIFLSSLML